MRKVLALFLLVVVSLTLIACTDGGDQTPPPVSNDIELVDLAGKNEEEITALFNGKINIQYIYTEDDSVESGTFLKYYGSRNIGDEVPEGTTVRIEIAGVKPTIYGVEDIHVYVSIPGFENPVDLETDVYAENYLGETIEFGQYLYIVGYKNAAKESIPSLNLFAVGTYYVTYRASDVVTKLSSDVDRMIIVETPVFDTNHTDDLRLTESYVGKSFIDDGIGEVVLSSPVDADTTNFRDTNSSTLNTRFAVRYLGIDAPEATSSFEPWGIPGAAFVREKLEGAEKIILQAEPNTARTDGNDRYLAWVWYVKDGVTRLLNLELVEQAYAYATIAGNQTLYGEILGIAAQETVLTHKRIHGEVDPDFDYSSDGTPVTIAELITNFDEYAQKQKVTLTGIITVKIGNSFYLESDGKGIYIYGGFNPTPEIIIGDEVVIQGLMPSYFPTDSPGKQASNYKYYNMTVISSENTVPIASVTPNQLGSYVGRLVEIQNLTIVEIDKTQAGTYAPYTIVAKNASNQTVNIRVDAVVANFLPAHDARLVAGTQISVSGPVNQFYSNYQLMLPGLNYITFLEGGE